MVGAAEAAVAAAAAAPAAVPAAAARLVGVLGRPPGGGDGCDVGRTRVASAGGFAEREAGDAELAPGRAGGGVTGGVGRAAGGWAVRAAGGVAEGWARGRDAPPVAAGGGDPGRTEGAPVAGGTTRTRRGCLHSGRGRGGGCRRNGRIGRFVPLGKAETIAPGLPGTRWRRRIPDRHGRHGARSLRCGGRCIRTRHSGTGLSRRRSGLSWGAGGRLCGTRERVRRSRPWLDRRARGAAGPAAHRRRGRRTPRSGPGGGQFRLLAAAVLAVTAVLAVAAVLAVRSRAVGSADRAAITHCHPPGPPRRPAGHRRRRGRVPRQSNLLHRMRRALLLLQLSRD